MNEQTLKPLSYTCEPVTAINFTEQNTRTRKSQLKTEALVRGIVQGKF